MLIEELIERSKTLESFKDALDLIEDFIELLTPEKVHNFVEYVEENNDNFNPLDHYKDSEILDEAQYRDLQWTDANDSIDNYSLEEIEEHVNRHYGRSISKFNNLIDNTLYSAIMATDPYKPKTEVEKLVLKHFGMYR